MSILILETWIKHVLLYNNFLDARATTELALKLFKNRTLVI